MICQTGEMDEARAAEVLAESAAVLRNAGARFAHQEDLLRRAPAHHPGTILGGLINEYEQAA